jgi:hypothetical protein
MTLDNPWKRLPRKRPFILPSDQPAITTFNRTAPLQFRIFDHLLPVPYLGLPEAPILLLNLNPGYSPEDESRQTTRRFQRAARKSLLHEAAGFSAGFYFLDYRIEGSDVDVGAGGRWWRRVFGRLLIEFGNDVVARSFFCVEYFPYRSRKFRPLGVTLEPQLYGFQLVHSAMRRRAVIIIMRSQRLWCEAIPQLIRYSRLFTIRNVLRPSLSSRNCPEGFPYVLRILERAGGNA